MTNYTAVLWVLPKHDLCTQVASRFVSVENLLPDNVNWLVKTATKERFVPSLCIYRETKLIYRMVGSQLTPNDLLATIKKVVNNVPTPKGT